MTRIAALMNVVGACWLCACHPPQASLPPPPKPAALGAIAGDFTAGPGRFVIGVDETTDPNKIRGAINDLFGGDPGHICFRGDPLRTMSLVSDAFPREAGKSESHFEGGRVVIRLANPLDPKHPLTTFEVWPCAELSVGGARAHEPAKVQAALFAGFTNGAPAVCFHGTEIEARSLVETVLREHKQFDKAEAKVGEITVWLSNPATPQDKKPRPFKFARCSK